MDRFLVRNIAFMPDGMSIDYMVLPSDARENGLAQTHNLWIPREADYDTEIEAVEQAAIEAVQDALEDFKRLPELDIKTQVEDALAKAAEDEDDDE